MDTLLKFSQENTFVHKSLEVIKEALNKYSINEICVSFNGGKDCTAVLNLVKTIAPNSWYSNSGEWKKLVAFHVRLPEYFEEECKFVADTVQKYDLELLTYTQTSIRDALIQLKIQHPDIKAIFIGSRHDDDPTKRNRLEYFHKTDSSWPEFMRINPILHWTYSNVWKYLLTLEVTYCDLYNQGYTSIGTKQNTTKNPNLLKTRSDGTNFYMPAWDLDESNCERNSRLTIRSKY